MIDLDLGITKDGCNNTKEREECAYYIRDNLKNVTTKLNGENRGIRYLSHTINVALSLFLRSKLGYDDVWASRLLFLPSPRLLASKTSKWKIRDNGDPSIYLSIQEEIGLSYEYISGHLMLDEISWNF